MPPFDDNKRTEIEGVFSVLFVGAARGVRGCWMMLVLWLAYFFTLLNLVRGGGLLVDDFP